MKMTIEKDLHSIAESLKTIAEVQQQMLNASVGKTDIEQHADVEAETVRSEQIKAADAAAVPAPPVAEVPAPPAPTPVAPEPQTESTLWTPEAINTLAGQTAERLGGPDKVIELFKQYGADGVSSLDTTRFNEFAQALKALV